MINPITDYISAHHSTKLLVATGGICALAATEMAVRTIANFFQLAQNNNQIEKNQIAENLSRNLFGTALFGMFASNAIPHLSVIGALIFAGNALLNNNEDALFVTNFVRVFKPLVSELFNSVRPFFKIIGDIVFSIFKTIGKFLSPILSFLGSLLNAVIPKTPEAYAATFLAAAIGIYKVYS